MFVIINLVDGVKVNAPGDLKIADINIPDEVLRGDNRVDVHCFGVIHHRGAM